MRIAHIGGYHAITMTLAQEQLRQGHEVTVLGTSGAEYDFEMPFACVEVPNPAAPDLKSTGWRRWFLRSADFSSAAQPVPKKLDPLVELTQNHFDVIQFHRTDGLLRLMPLARRTMDEALRALRESGARLFLFSYGVDPIAHSTERTRLELEDRAWSDYFECIFIGSPDNSELSQLARRWSWLGIPVDLEALVAAEPRAPKPGELTMLYIPYRVEPQESQAVITQVEQLGRAGFKFEFKLVHPEDIHSREMLLETIDGCDMLIEHLERQSFGLLAIEAMALGKTVLSGNAAGSRLAWEQLATCPVLDTTAENLEKRLTSIIREPRCLRDLGQRSRRYVETYHNSKAINLIMLEAYKRAGVRI